MMRKRVLGDASDIPAILPEKIASAKVYASLADFVAEAKPTRLMGFRGVTNADGLPVVGFGGDEEEGLLIVPRTTSPTEIGPLFALAAGRPSLDLCFLDYLTWLPDAEKNLLVAVINSTVNGTPSAWLTAYIVDREGRPRIVVSFREPAQRPSA